MPYAHVSPRPSSLKRALRHALVLGLLPLGTAFAEPAAPYPFVRVTHDGTEISALRQEKVVRMRAPKGTVLEVFFIEGDRYTHRDSNWYWVLLPTDKLGNRPTGWVRGDDVEHIAPPPMPAGTPAVARGASAPDPSEARTEPATAAAAAASNVSVTAAPVEEAPFRPFVTDVVLNFEFGKAELTDEARRKLASAVSIPKPNARFVAVALEGHADWIGTEAYNERLGLARAESVRQYLAEQLRIPAERISVVSYGESDPAAPNTTRAGRAQNRRVVIRAGA